MYVLPATQPYETRPFVSNFCQTEFDGKMETALESKLCGSLSRMLRRNSSSSSLYSQQFICSADATQIEINVTTLASDAVTVTIETPTGEAAQYTLAKTGDQCMFSPSRQGCGHGIWTLRIHDSDNHVLSEQTMQLNGVGSLYFVVDVDNRVRLTSQEFLQVSPVCPKHHH